VKVLITGGAGFIGSHLCDAFLKYRNQVKILDNLSTGSRNNINHLIEKVHLIEGDIRDVKLVDSLIQDSDLVVHMAAALGVNNILTKPIESISTNYYGSQIVLNASSKFNKRIIIASSSEIYGKNPVQPLSEESDRILGNPQKIRWTYSDAKALEEATAHYLFTSQNLNVTTLRFFNTVGPRQTGQYGMVIPRFVGAALSNKPLEVYGDGTQTRVFCHVLDAVNAVMKIIEHKNTIGEVFNIGGQGELSILSLAKLVKEKTNSNSEINFVPYAKAYSQGFEEMPRRIPDISKIQSFTKWKPKRNINEIILDVVSSFAKKI
jgi:UDP-glucose 4-epimerase